MCDKRLADQKDQSDKTFRNSLKNMRDLLNKRCEADKTAQLQQLTEQNQGDSDALSKQLV